MKARENLPRIDMEKRAKIETLQTARGKILEAEDLLATALREIEIAPRAEKITISETVRQAFDNLRLAKGALSALEKLVLEESD